MALITLLLITPTIVSVSATNEASYFGNHIIKSVSIFCLPTQSPTQMVALSRPNSLIEQPFIQPKFSDRADFHSAKFSGEADFSGIVINDKAYFSNVLFEDGKKILFGIEDLSRVSFMNTDITRVRFNDRARWGKEDKFKVFEEETLEKELPETKTPNTVSLDSVMVVYRNLRENYEYKLTLIKLLVTSKLLKVIRRGDMTESRQPVSCLSGRSLNGR